MIFYLLFINTDGDIYIFCILHIICRKFQICITKRLFFLQFFRFHCTWKKWNIFGESIYYIYFFTYFPIYRAFRALNKKLQNSKS